MSQCTAPWGLPPASPPLLAVNPHTAKPLLGRLVAVRKQFLDMLWLLLTQRGPGSQGRPCRAPSVMEKPPKAPSAQWEVWFPQPGLQARESLTRPLPGAGSLPSPPAQTGRHHPAASFQRHPCLLSSFSGWDVPRTPPADSRKLCPQCGVPS